MRSISMKDLPVDWSKMVTLGKFVRSKGIVCGHCRIFANQSWFKVKRFKEENPHAGQTMDDVFVAVCDHCGKYSVFHETTQVYPDAEYGPPPNKDLDEQTRGDYMEASAIAAKSPRGAAALLRLCIQKLCNQLGEAGKDLNNDIGNLVKKGLPEKIQQALDVVRVVGNNAVHPGQIDMTDDVETARALFDLVNLIADSMISQPRRVKAMYDNLPPTALKQIEERNGPGKEGKG